MKLRQILLLTLCLTASYVNAQSGTLKELHDEDGDPFYIEEMESGEDPFDMEMPEPWEPDSVGDMPGPNDFVNAEETPRPLNINQVVQRMGYPEQAKREKVEGKVALRILVDEKGHYVRHILLNEGHPLLSPAVEAHASQLVFIPGILHGKPCPMWVTVPFLFKLAD